MSHDINRKPESEATRSHLITKFPLDQWPCDSGHCGKDTSGQYPTAKWEVNYLDDTPIVRTMLREWGSVTSVLMLIDGSRKLRRKRFGGWSDW